jgi:protoporphyrinogen oxidase
VSPEPGNTDHLVSMKIYASGDSSKQLLTMTDSQAKNELLRRFAAVRHTVLKPDAQALSTVVQQWPEALPIFSQGYYGKLKDFAEGKIERHEGTLVFAGDYLGGPLMEGAFTSGRLAAQRLHTRLKSQS